MRGLEGPLSWYIKTPVQKEKQLNTVTEPLPRSKRVANSARKRFTKMVPVLAGGWGSIRRETLLLSGVDRHNLIQEGLKTRILLRALRTFRYVPEDQLLLAIGLSTKTLGRREESRLGPRHSDAAMALIDVTDMAEHVLGTRELAEHWLSKSALALDGRRPMDLLTSTPGVEAVKDLLTRMEYGVYA